MIVFKYAIAVIFMLNLFIIGPALAIYCIVDIVKMWKEDKRR